MTSVKRLPISCIGHTRSIVRVAFSGETADGIFMVSASKDGKSMLRNGMTGDWIGTFEGHEGALWDVDIDEKAQRIVTASADFTGKLFDATNGHEILSLQHPHVVKAVAFSPKNHNQIVTASGDKSVRLFDIRARPQDCKVLFPHSNVMNRVMISSDGTHVISGGDDGVVWTYDLVNSAVQMYPISSPIIDLCRASDGSIIASCTTSIRHLSATGELLDFSLATPSPVFTASSYQNGNLLTWAGENNTIYLCTNDGTVQDELHRHFGNIRCLRFSPDGCVFASCSEDGTLLLWQTYPGQEYGLWKGFDS
eukprot:gene5037-128_t